ncbi:unnamed protein product [Symbiodinium sp. CCMP2592]|nr:unnamed protein product [Symbiodinium sp. CCMP2592]
MQCSKFLKLASPELPSIMAPKAKSAGAKAKASGQVQKTAAKTAAKNKWMGGGSRVKREKSTPPKAKREATGAPPPDPATTANSGGTLGFARGTISALLTSLKYQARAFRNRSKMPRRHWRRSDVFGFCFLNVLISILPSPPWKKYEQAESVEKKRLILSRLQEYGVKNCSWVNTLHQAVENKDTNNERTRTNMSKILELKGIECDGATDIEKDEILEEVLKEAEAEFQYDRKVEKHAKFSCLNKCVFKYTEGMTETTATESTKKMESWANNLKKGNQLSLELLSKELRPQWEHDSYKLLAEKHKELNGLRAKLRTNSEELMLIQTQIRSAQDPAWNKKLEEITTASEVLDEFLKEVRVNLAEGLPNDKSGDYQDKVGQTIKFIEQCTNHHKASGHVIKQTKQLMSSD